MGTNRNTGGPEVLRPDDFFDLSESTSRPLFDKCDFVWDALANLNEYLASSFDDERIYVHGEISGGATIVGGPIYIGRDVNIQGSVWIEGPAYIGDSCQILHGAKIRDGAIMEDGALLGHCSELKHSIMLKESKAPHKAYIGDSIIGNRVNLGAGAVLSNLSILSRKDKASGTRPSLKIRHEEQVYDTGFPKLGAILGDDVQIGCNCTTNPGCLIGPGTIVYPNIAVQKGIIPAGKLVKLRQEIEIIDVSPRP
jgi:NDP-sugar pyrophosphorylase family protein